MENDINAFAGPGGYVGVNSGLILITEAESELASVMAHEILTLPNVIYSCSGSCGSFIYSNSCGNPGCHFIRHPIAAMGQAAIMAIMAGNVQFQINFTRENEEEADRVGMQILAGSQFDPRSMPTFFERLQQSTRYYGQAIPEFLRTHPVTASRISDTRGRAETYPYKQYPDSLGYQLTKAKIRILTTTDPAAAHAYFQSRLTQGTIEQRTVAVMPWINRA